MSRFSPLIDRFDFMKHETTVAVTFGFLRLNGFLEYNVKWDDFVSIISNYITYKHNNIKVIANKTTIHAFDDNLRVKCIDSLNKQFIVAVTDATPQMYVTFN